MNNNVRDIIFNTVKKNSMLAYRDKVIVGVSGGADSMCLLHFLVSIADELKLNIIVAHINHNLRGDEAVRDQKTVEKFCKKLNVKCEVLSADINEISARTGESCEECGRRIRYEFFNKMCGENGKIATAHTLSDSSETVIFNLARGTGLKGLTGIPKVRENIIRPLIDITRSQVEVYCSYNNIQYVTDSTNLENDYNRNKIRNAVTPVLKEINPSFEYSVKRLSAIAEDYLSLTNELANEIIKNSEIEKFDCAYNYTYLKECNKTVLNQVIINILKKSGCNSYEERHISLIKDIIANSYGSVELPKGFVFILKQGIIRVCKKEKISLKSQNKTQIKILFPKKNSEFIINNQKIKFEFLSKQKFDEIVNVNNLLLKNALNCDIIQCETQIRTRMPKDVFNQKGRGVRKSLKKLFTETKIPSENRDNVIVVANGNTVLWVDGFGVSQEVCVTSQTKKVVLISVEKSG